jgi:protein tyrosine phosphatase
MADVRKLVDIVCAHANSKKPVVVHCSAGCGRTGTFIAICNVIMAVEELKQQVKLKPKSDYDLTPRISVFSTVRKLREQRWTMVKTESQYKSIYEFLRFYYSK